MPTGKTINGDIPLVSICPQLSLRRLTGMDRQPSKFINTVYNCLQELFGQEVYRATVYVDGRRTDDWLHYWMQPIRTGGGIVDGARRSHANTRRVVRALSWWQPSISILNNVRTA